MTFLNEAEWDRTVRLVVGIAFLIAGTILVGGGAGLALIGAGALAVVTGIAGWCPAYTACGISTRKVSDASRPFRG